MDEDAAAALLGGQEQLWRRGLQVGNNIRGRGRGRADHDMRQGRGANNNVRQGRGANNNVRPGRGVPNNVRQGQRAHNNLRQGRGPHNNVRGGRQNDQPVNAINQQRERGGDQDQRARNDDPYQARRGNNNRIDNEEDDGDAREHRQNRPLGYRALQEIVQAEGPDLLTKLNGRSKAFAVLLDQNIESPDIYVLVIKLVAKVCLLAFEQLKMQLLLDICNSKFISNLRNYLMDLPYASAGDRRKNNQYWSKPKEFWEDLICFYEFIIMRSPSTALQKCRALIDSATKASLNDLRDRTGFVLSNDSNAKLNELREKLLICEIEEEKKVQRYQHPEISANEEPPEDFRQMSVLPTREDLMNDRPFLRPNIVKGVYRDIHHYLDVQFRLLREDCIGPLRTGIMQFINTPKKKRFDNIRVFKDVKFIGPYTSQSNVGMMVQFEDSSSKRFKRTNWAHNKRLLFGSLLIFTNNNFESFFLATVLDRDLKFLEKGQIPVSIVESPETMTAVRNDVAYMMVESEVYFEPYYHVLRALQDPTFPNQMAMRKYIVDVDPVPQHPAYLERDTEYTIELRDGYPSQKVRILEADSWPTADDLGLNNSQYDAFKLALVHEFAVIQGPPGTGKTFLGVKVAQTLLENLKGSRLLLICFTNHALDQFLEAILPVTESLVRIGGQSRCEALQEYNLSKLRHNKRFGGYRSESQRMFDEKRFELKTKVTHLQAKQEELELINNEGIISYRTLREDVPGIRCLERYYTNNAIQDPLLNWLFERLEYNEYNEDIEIDDEIIPPQVNFDEDVDEQRLDLILDDLDIGSDHLPSISTSFKLKNELDKLTRLRKAVKANKGTHRNLDDLQAEVQFTYLMIKRFKDMQVIKNIVPNEPVQFDVNRDPRTYTIADRWTQYFGLVRQYSERLRNEIWPLQKTQQEAFTAYEEARQILDLQLLKNVKVVGMTTTGAARLKKLVQTLAPDIVIVEEAAEVMESHIVTALSSSCKHLILIGDHQQLRPSAASYRLARDYNLEVSLFERMIANKIHSRRLAVQHRMRPEIAALITPSIYEELHNHASVEAFPHVRGVENNLFFMSHEFKETSAEDTPSRSNEREGDLCLRLANYLMQQGYDPEHVTILAAYSGQMFYMRKERPNYAFLSKVKITVVDNYQGEESKIIILSLVRNNDENQIGFLGTVNRVCVALSRAREGFYIFGNIDILKRSADIWNKIAATLDDNGSLGTSLRLKCESHPNQITNISLPAHFDTVPEGGCLLKCDANLRCGHVCPRICHGYDRGHVEIECPLPCERIICELGHVCPLRCTQECKPCMVLVRRTLPCKHEMMVFCHQDPTEPGIKCMTTLTVKLPHCGHEAKKPCYLDINLVQCYIPCEFRVDPCGHKCRQKCHVLDDPDHTKYTCEKPCARAKKGCSAGLVGDHGDHQCNKRCHETCDDCLVEVVKKRSSCSHMERVACCKDVNEVTCRKNCKRSLPCGHFCKKKCFEDCGDCKQMVKKTIPSCGHEVKIECRAEATREFCRMQCERPLPCGHPCTGRCDRPCNPDQCTRLIDCGLPAPCGHKVDLPCNVYRTYIAGERDPSCLLRHCASPCAVTLACEHACGGSCGACRQGRLHAPCTQTCRQDNICGHQCQEPCNQVCPPCKRPCEVRCVHTKCKKICGAPCTPCQEKCERACAHRRCVRSCADPCAPFQPCSEPCAERQPCGHRCRGLCGEPCPQICKECRPGDFPTDFLGDDFEEDDKFVKLQDCPHVMELENMDNLMTGDSESISIRACPLCRAAVINTPRYKDLINAMFRQLINPIKEKVYGTKGQIKAKQLQLTERALLFATDHKAVLKGDKHWSAAFLKISRVIKAAGAKLSLLQLEMYSVYLDILELLADCFDKFKKANITVLVEEYSGQMELLCNTLADNMQKLSQQQQKDIGNEIKRTHAIIQLATLMSNPAFLNSKTVSKVDAAADAAKRAILSWYAYEDDNAHEALKDLQEAIKLSGIITRQEKDLIVKAMGLKQGHWYKCPNGHIYCITECGGAMVESKCNECGAIIGGGSHRLRSDNAVATEMDGASRSAWSNQYNDMANWRFDD